ncbi:hypothetical protein ACFE04_011575 [Oxalis oulophora]
MKKQILILTISITLLSTLIPISNCQKNSPQTVARKEDIPYIKCQVCETLASQLYNQVQKQKTQISPKKITEYQIIEIAENVCNLKKEEADWILKIDIVEQGDKLELVEQDAEGMCNSECKTIERACSQIIEYSDTDVAEYIFSSKPDLQTLTNYLCKSLSKACSTKPPPVPKNRIPGEPFMAKPAKEAEMEKMMRSMQGMPGAPGMKMYSRDDLMNNKNLGDEDGDEDEDEDESDKFASNLKKVFKEKESKKPDWKQTISKGIKDSSEALKKHAYRVSNRARQWWGGKKTGQKSNAGKIEL